MGSGDGGACPACGSARHERVLLLCDLPVLVNGQVSPSAAAEVARGDIDLAVCDDCAHLFNHAFDPARLRYGNTYENSLHCSPRFQAFAVELVDRLVHAHRLAGGRVAELGCGPGHLLSMLRRAGVAEAKGWDPSFDPLQHGAPADPAITISTDAFPEDGAYPVDVALSRHVLEHLDDPATVLTALREAVVARRGAVYSEVPNGALMVSHGALWDLIYEHFSYFVPSSLGAAHRRGGLRVTSTGTAFDEQFLWCESVPDDAPAGDELGIVDTPIADIEAAVVAARRFGELADRRIDEAREELSHLRHRGPVALWGAGSKGTTYANLVSDVAKLDAVVDINPRKAGWGVPGTELVIGGPETLATDHRWTVIAANPIYIQEIEGELSTRGVSAEVRPLWT